MAGNSSTCICSDDPDFQELVVNIFEETSNSEGTEDDFQGSFQNTESEEEASDEEHDDYNNNTGNNGEDGYFLAKNFVWLKKFPPQNVHTRIHNNISRLRGQTTQRKLEQDYCTQKGWTCYLPKPCYKN